MTNWHFIKSMEEKVSEGVLKNLASDPGCHCQAKLGGVYHAQTKFEGGTQRQHVTFSTAPLTPLIFPIHY